MKKKVISLKFSIKKKLIILSLVLLVVPTLFLGISSYRYSKIQLDIIGQETLKNAVNLAMQVIEDKQKEVSEGKLTTKEAQEQVKVFLIGEKNVDGVTRKISSKIDLGENGYFAIYNKQGYEVAHPLMEGQYVLEIPSKGKDKLLLVKDCIQKAENGGGFTYYEWDVPGTDKAEPKIAYTALEPNWGWYISASSYMASFNQEADKLWNNFILTLVIAIAIGSAIVWMFSNKIALPIIELSNFIKKIETSKYTAELPKDILDREDEIGVLARTIESMNIQLLDSFQKLYSQNEILENEVKERRKAQVGLSLTYEVIGSSKEAIFIADSNRKIIYINKAFSKITGYNKNEIVDNYVEEMHFCKLDKYNEVIEAIKENGFWMGEFTDINKNGEEYPVFLSLKRVVSEESNECYYVGIFEDLTRAKEDEENINYLKKHDVLTGLPGKSLISERLNSLIHDVSRANKIIGVMTLGLDDFKFINEAMGHTSGDILLMELAKRLRGFIKDEDTIARITGDEFAIVLEEVVNINQITNMADSLLTIFHKPFRIKGRDIFITASIGISIYPVDGLNAEMLIMNATSAQNHVKKNGKNNYQFYYRKMNEDAFGNLEMTTSLRKAIEREEFVLYYQPQVDLNTGEVAGMEALIRWNHPKFGLLFPDRFIALAERTGLIAEISNWVLKEACRQNKKWHEEGYDNLSISVNLSAMEFIKKDLAKNVKHIVEETKLSPQFVEVEITEGILMGNVEQSIEILTELKNIGVRIAIDDFGTGYSSLNYLRQFPIDRLKIDRSFIMGIPETDNGAIAKIIIELAKSLGLKVVAEGVESKYHVTFLKERNCDEIQGYYFSKPIPVDKMDELLKNKKCLE